MSKLLIIEDDQALSSLMKAFLESKKFQIDLVSDGQSGLEWLTQVEYAAAIIDWELPNLSGVEICRNYRNGGGMTPIIMLTGRGQVKDKITGLDAGADDYLAKPFDMEELAARIRSLLRRPPSTAGGNTLSLGPIEMDLEKNLVSIDRSIIELSPTEFAILELFLRNPGCVYNTDAIIEKIWSINDEVSAETVRSHITRLRKKLYAASEQAGNCLKNSYGIGYRMELP